MTRDTPHSADNGIERTAPWRGQVGIANPMPLRRFDLVEAVHAYLREAILRGEFGKQLMAERSLSQALGVSRATLRAALGRLEAEELLRKSGSRGEREVLAGRRVPKAPSTYRVRLLESGNMACDRGEYLRLVRGLSEHLKASGISFRVETHASCFSSRPSRALKRVAENIPTDLWILHKSNEAMQQWFAKAGTPCLVLGSSFDGVLLPCIDSDHAAISRHAAGMLLARGHKKIAVLHLSSILRGDLDALDAVREIVGASSREDVSVLSQPFNDTTEEIITAVNALLRLPTRPDGWLVFGAETYLTVATHLARRGIRVGEDISLICRNADPFFASMTPSVAHYRRDTRQFLRHLSKLIQGLVEHRALPVTRTLIQSTFEDGDSLRKATAL